MQSKTLSFSKIEKSIEKIDETLNDLLKKVTFKFATQNQSQVKGKMVCTLFFEPKPGSVRAKAFRDQYEKKLDITVNDFISDKKIVFVTQTFIGSSIYTIVYYSIEKDKVVTPPTEPTAPVTPPAANPVTVTVETGKSIVTDTTKTV